MKTRQRVVEKLPQQNVYRENKRLVGATILFTTLAFFLIFLIYVPLMLLGLLSFSSEPLAGIPGGFTWRWYLGLFDELDWWPPLLLTVKVALLVSMLCTLMALLVGRQLPRLKRGKIPMMLLFLLPLVVPGMVLGIQEFTFYRTFLGIRTGLWSLVLTHFIWAYPFALMGMLVVTLRFDTNLLDAAADLGASGWQRFWDIELPLLMPGVITAALFGFMLSITELPRSLFTRGDELTLPVYVWAESAARVSHIPLIYCLNTLITIVSIVVAVLAVKVLGESKATSNGQET